MGAIRALHEAGLRVPDDVSVIGFDDVLGAPFGIPSLTTIRQPLREMGKTGAEFLINRINHPKAPYPQQLVLQPELVIRESTARASSRCPSQRRNPAGLLRVAEGEICWCYWAHRNVWPIFLKTRRE